MVARVTDVQKKRPFSDQARQFNRMRRYKPAVFVEHVKAYLAHNKLDNPFVDMLDKHQDYAAMHDDLKLTGAPLGLKEIADRDGNASPAANALNTLDELYQSRHQPLQDLNNEFLSTLIRVEQIIENNPGSEMPDAAITALQARQGDTTAALERQHELELSRLNKLFTHDPQPDDDIFENQEDYQRTVDFQDALARSFGVASLDEDQLRTLRQEEAVKLKNKHVQEMQNLNAYFENMKKNFVDPYRADFRKAVFFAHFDPRDLERYKINPEQDIPGGGVDVIVDGNDVDEIDLLAIDSYVTPNGRGLVQINEHGGLTITHKKNTGFDARVDTYTVALEHQIARDAEIAKRQGKEYDPANRTLNFKTDSPDKAEAMYTAYKKMGLREKINIKVGKGPGAKTYPDDFLTTQKERDDFETRFSKYRSPEELSKDYKNYVQDILKEQQGLTGDQIRPSTN